MPEKNENSLSFSRLGQENGRPFGQRQPAAVAPRFPFSRVPDSVGAATLMPDGAWPERYPERVLTVRAKA